MGQPRQHNNEETGGQGGDTQTGQMGKITVHTMVMPMKNKVEDKVRLQMMNKLVGNQKNKLLSKVLSNEKKIAYGGRKG